MGILETVLMFLLVGPNLADVYECKVAPQEGGGQMLTECVKLGRENLNELCAVLKEEGVSK